MCASGLRNSGCKRLRDTAKPSKIHAQRILNYGVTIIYQNETTTTKKAAHKGGLFKEYFN